jgi:hypothetical protein
MSVRSVAVVEPLLRAGAVASCVETTPVASQRPFRLVVRDGIAAGMQGVWTWPAARAWALE